MNDKKYKVKNIRHIQNMEDNGGRKIKKHPTPADVKV